MDEQAEEPAQAEAAGPPRHRAGAKAGLLLVVLLLILLNIWAIRVPIAENFIDREFARRGVPFTYDTKRIGLGRQRFENLVIGDPAAPDLVARSVELDLSFGFRAPRVELIRARGVRLRGRLVNGQVSFGSVDRLLPEPTGEPFRLPNQRVDIADSAVVIDTPAGRAAIGIEGRGNLSDGFRGHLAAVSREMRMGECVLGAPNALLRVVVRDHQPSFRGPVAASALRCGDDLDIVSPRLTLDATLSRAFDAWRGRANAEVAGFRVAEAALGPGSGRLSFRGDYGATGGEISLVATRARLGSFGAARTDLAGRYAISLRQADFTMDGNVRAHGISGGREVLAPVADTLEALGSTPLEPVGFALGRAVRRASESVDAQASFSLANRSGSGRVQLDRLRAHSRSGARLVLSGGEGLTVAWPGGGWRIGGDIALTGGGFPDSRFRISQTAGGALRGTGWIAPLAAGDGRLALGEVRIDAGPDGTTRIDTFATIDGPIPEGRIEGLALPIQARFAGRGAFLMNPACTEARWRVLRLDGVRIGPTALRLCPVGPGLIWDSPGQPLRAIAEIPAPRLAGSVGDTPIRIAADRLRFNFADPQFDAANVAIRLGDQAAPNRFDMAAISGRFGPRGVTGPFTRLSARIPGVPLLFGEGNGTWSLTGDGLALAGGLTVEDEEQPPRFNPLVGDDFRLTLQGDQIRGAGLLRHPPTGAAVTEVRLEHDLGAGRGRAVLDVPGIAFTPGGLQPDDLTRLTRGVVALVDGTVRGRGEVRWDEAGTTSTGTFSTQGMNLAAPFGPVENLTTTIRFTDLLGLVSAPGQVANVGVVRTGIDVLDGVIRYQLLADNRVRIEAGRWPFAGGELVLEETILDFGQPSVHRLTFRVIGADAASFIQMMEFGNIAATGTFDGVIPMEFDQRGGRIVGGWLEAREGGGTLSYIGELTDRDLGTWGKLAFDALKSLRYSHFRIGLDGSLEGEFLSRIRIDGVNRVETGGHWLVRRFANIPFIFNIRVQGPFRAVIGTARSIEDPSLLIQTVLPETLRVEPIETDVQRDESEDVR